MGQYEPDDSRNVTLKDGHEPGGLKRTGPREDEVRRQAEQSQSQSGRSQQQQQQGGDPQSALDDPPGDPRPEYDQYETNQPDNLNKRGYGQAPEAQAAYGNSRDEQGRMEQQPDEQSGERREQAEMQEGGTMDGDGFVGETARDPARRARADAYRPL